jgi:hypothetical protein
MEANGVVCVPVDTHLADGCALTKHRTCHMFLPSLMNARPCHSPWLSHEKAHFKAGTCQLREKTLTEKHQKSRIAGGWHMVGHSDK